MRRYYSKGLFFKGLNFVCVLLKQKILLQRYGFSFTMGIEEGGFLWYNGHNKY